MQFFFPSTPAAYSFKTISVLQHLQISGRESLIANLSLLNYVTPVNRKTICVVNYKRANEQEANFWIKLVLYINKVYCMHASQLEGKAHKFNKKSIFLQSIFFLSFYKVNLIRKVN